MDSREIWEDRVRDQVRQLGLNWGYKFLYGPWSGIGSTDVAFVSLNPGKAPKGADLETLTDERGNSYEVERDVTASPITEQFLALADLIGVPPSQILTGAFVPFRTGNWADLDATARRAGLTMGREFWRQVFAKRRPRLVIATGADVGKELASLFQADVATQLPSGWGNVAIRRYEAQSATVIVQFPHLSRFRLMSREVCLPHVRRALEI